MASAEQQAIKIIREVIRPPFRLFLGDDGIVRIYTHDSAWITVKEAKSLISALGEITGGLPHLVLKFPGRHTINDKESRSFIASKEGMKFSIAEAIVASNIGHRVMGKLISWIDNPLKPIKIFNNEDDAISWLNKQNHK